jgi:hypothetical protein
MPSVVFQHRARGTSRCTILLLAALGITPAGAEPHLQRLPRPRWDQYWRQHTEHRGAGPRLSPANARALPQREAPGHDHGRDLLRLFEQLVLRLPGKHRDNLAHRILLRPATPGLRGATRDAVDAGTLSALPPRPPGLSLFLAGFAATQAPLYCPDGLMRSIQCANWPLRHAPESPSVGRPRNGI